LTALLPELREALLLQLAQRVCDSVCAADQNPGHLEEELLHGGHEIFRQMLEKVAQQKSPQWTPAL
jgi:hypothetical protein